MESRRGLDLARRSFLARAGMVALGAGASTIFVSGASAAATQPGDIGVIQTALALEHEGIAAYQIAGKSGLQCGGCHSVETNRIGPRHRGVVGRRIASVADYDYSPALKRLGGVWTANRLDLWLSGTQKMAPGSKMYLARDDADERHLIIDYLKSICGPGGSK